MTYTKDHLRQIFQQPFNIQEWQQMLQHYFQAKDLRVEPECIMFPYFTQGVALLFPYSSLTLK